MSNFKSALWTGLIDSIILAWASLGALFSKVFCTDNFSQMERVPVKIMTSRINGAKK